MSFIRQRSPARWAQAETLASVIDARLQADPTNAHADALARISSAARAFVTDSRASTAALDGSPETAHPAVLSALRAGHHFETALDAYPLRWVDRLIYEPLLWLALVAGLVLAAATIAHAAMWMGGSVDTWAQRDRRRLHARLFWGAFLTEVFVALIAFLLLATHSLNNGIAVVAVSVLAAAGLAARMIAEQRGQEIIDVLKDLGRVPEWVLPAWSPPDRASGQTAVRTHRISVDSEFLPPAADDRVLVSSDDPHP